MIRMLLGLYTREWRDRYGDELEDLKVALSEACAVTVKCRFDGFAVANYAFVKSDLSTRDYFHPSLSGQATLAALTWQKTQWVS